MKKIERQQPVKREDAHAVIASTLRAARMVKDKPGLNADEIIRLGWALGHCSEEIDDVLSENGLLSPGADHDAQQRQFIIFMRDAVQEMARRSRQLRMRKAEPAATKRSSPLSSNAMKAAVSLQAELSAMTAQERNEFFEPVTSAWPPPPEEIARSVATTAVLAFGSDPARFVFEQVLILLASEASQRPQRKFRIGGVTTAFVNAAAIYWESETVGRSVNGGLKAGSLGAFCALTSEKFGLGLETTEIETAVTELVRKRRLAASKTSA